MSKKAARRLMTVIEAAFLVLVLVICWFNVLETSDLRLQDLVYQRGCISDNRIKIIAIDSKSLEKYGAYADWSRNIPAQLIQVLNSSDDKKPAVLCFDVMYIENRDAQADAALAEAAGEAGNVVAASDVEFKTGVVLNGDGTETLSGMLIKNVLQPYDALCANVRTGYANAVEDDDGRVRRCLACLDTENGTEYSLAVETYRAYMQSRGLAPELPRLYGASCFHFAYTGVSGSYETFSLCDVLDGTIPAGVFNNKIVLVGAYASGLQDNYAVPIGSSQMYGVEINANIVDSLLNGYTTVPLSNHVCAVITVLQMFAFLAYLQVKKVRGILPGMAAELAVSAVGAYVFYICGYTVQLLYTPVCILLIAVLALAKNFAVVWYSRRKMSDVFKRYIPVHIVDEVLGNNEYQINLGGDTRYIGVLFLDIRGFTALSETMTPQEVISMLNTYLNMATEIILNHGGMIDKYIGDCIMALFNVPIYKQGFLLEAVSAGVEIQQSMEKLSPTVRFGIGIHVGDAVVGNMGSKFRVDFTAVGDTVNTASRIESKAGKGQVLISSEVYEQLKDKIIAQDMGEISVKGKKNALHVYNVTGIMKTEDSK